MAIDTTHMAAESGFESGEKKNFQTLPPAKNIHIKSGRLILCYKVTQFWSERSILYEGWNFNSGNYLFTTDTK